MPQEFPPEVILTVTTGRLLCDIGLLYPLLDFLADDKLWTHQLGRVADECSPFILRQYPQFDPDGPLLGGPLKALDASIAALKGSESEHSESSAVVRRWVAAHVRPFFDAAYPLDPIPASEHTRISPIIEVQMMTDGEVVVVHAGPDGDVTIMP